MVPDLGNRTRSKWVRARHGLKLRLAQSVTPCETLPISEQKSDPNPELRFMVPDLGNRTRSKWGRVLPGEGEKCAKYAWINC